MRGYPKYLVRAPVVGLLQVCEKIRSEVGQLVEDLRLHQRRALDQHTGDRFAHLRLVRVLWSLQSKNDRSSLAHAEERDHGPVCSLGPCWGVENLKEGICRGKGPAFVSQLYKGVQRTFGKVCAVAPSNPIGQPVTKSAPQSDPGHRVRKGPAPCRGFVLNPFYEVPKVVCAKLAHGRLGLRHLVCGGRRNQETNAVAQGHAGIPRFTVASLQHHQHDGKERTAGDNREYGPTPHPCEFCTGVIQ